jgi:hypothetical protein
MQPQARLCGEMNPTTTLQPFLILRDAAVVEVFLV